MSTGPVSHVVLEPAAQSFLDALAAHGVPSLSALSFAETRALLDQLQSAERGLTPGEIEPHAIPDGKGGAIPVTVVRPVGSNGSLPAILYCCGGGGSLGTFSTHQRLLRELAQRSGAAIVVPDYAPLAEEAYPSAVELAYATMTWVAERGAELGLDGARLAVAGDGVGGTLAVAISLFAQKRESVDIRYQVLFYPATSASMSTTSYAQFATGPWLTRPVMERFWDTYAPQVEVREAPIVSPLHATAEQLRGLPPTLIITAEADILRDEGEALGDLLGVAGVDTVTTRLEGVFHDFLMLNGLAETRAARQAIAQASKALNRALSSESI